MDLSLLGIGPNLRLSYDEPQLISPRTPEGKKYYHNRVTKVTTWTKPEEFKAVESPQSFLKSKYEEDKKPSLSTSKRQSRGREKPDSYFDDEDDEFPALPPPRHLKETDSAKDAPPEQEEVDELDAFMAGVENTVTSWFIAHHTNQCEDKSRENSGKARKVIQSYKR